MRFIQPGLSVLAVIMLLISLYRFVEGFQNWQEARENQTTFLGRVGRT